MDQGVAERARHPGVDLGHHVASRADDRHRHVRRKPVEQNPCRSGGLSWTSAQSTSAKSRRPREEDRHEVGAAVGHGLAHVRRDEERGDAEAPRVLRARRSGPGQRERVETWTSRSAPALAVSASTRLSGSAAPVPIKTRSPERIPLTASSAVTGESRPPLPATFRSMDGVALGDSAASAPRGPVPA